MLLGHQKARPLNTRRVGGRGSERGNVCTWARLEPPSVHILVVAANNQARALRADAEKGFVWTAVAHESVDPKPQEKSDADEAGWLPADRGWKGIRNPAAEQNHRALETQALRDNSKDPCTVSWDPSRVLFCMSFLVAWNTLAGR